MESRTESKASDLYVACIEKDVDKIKVLLKDETIDVNAVVNGVNPLILACRRGLTEIVDLLLKDKRVDVNKKVVITSDLAISSLGEALTNGNTNIALLFLCNNRVDKTDVLSIASGKASDMLRWYRCNDYDSRLRNAEYQKLQMIFADQEYKGMEFFLSDKGIDIIFKAMLSVNAAPNVSLTHSSDNFTFDILSESEKEFCLEFFSYVLFADKKTECSSESLQTTVGVITAKAQERLSTQNLDYVLAEAAKTQLEFFEGVFQKFILNLADNEDLQAKLKKMYELSDKLDRFKSMSARRNAFKYTHLYLSCDGSAFNILPLDVKYKIASRFFPVPEKQENRITQVAIEQDRDEFLKHCGMK